MLLSRVSDIYRSILSNYFKREYRDRTPFNNIDCKNPNNVLPFESIYLGAKVEELNSEWRSVADLTEVKKLVADRTYTETFGSHIFSMNNNVNELMFSSLKIFLQCLLSLSHSAEAAERRFSQVSLLKNKLRNRLEIETLDTILHTKELLNDKYCYSWEPFLSLMKRKIKY